MIKVTTLRGGGGDVARYLTEHKRVEQYYTGQDPDMVRGVYIGGSSLGVDGREVGPEFAKFLEKENPITGEKYYHTKARKGEKPRLGFDVTMSPDKSFGVLWAREDDAGRKRLEKLFHDSVRDTIAYVEGNILGDCVRRGKGGIDREAPRELTWAVFQHGTSRPVEKDGITLPQDPQPHAHCVLLNLVQRQDGTYGALSENILYKAQKEMTAVFDSVMHQKLRDELGLAVHKHEHGFRIDGVSQDLIQHYSKRREEIEGLAAEIGTTTARAGNTLAVGSRIQKGELREDELIPIWQKEMDSMAWSIDQAKGLYNQVTPELGGLTQARIDLGLDAAMGKAAKDKTIMSESQIRAFVVDAFSGEVPIEKIQPLFKEALDSGRFVPLLNEKGQTIYTTRTVIERERAIVERARGMAERNPGTKVLDQTLVEETLKRYTSRAERPMTRQQAAAARHILDSGQLSVFIGAAGTGKSFSLKVVKEVLEESGYTVIGTSPTGKASQGLKTSAEIEHCSTLDRLLIDIDRGKVKLDQKTIVIVDEAGMLGSEKFERIQKAVESAGSRMTLVGDDKQAPPIDQGRPFALIKEAIGAAEITEVMRQRDAWQKEASNDFREGHALKALQAYQDHGMVHHAQTWDTLKTKVLGDWFKDRMQEPEKTRMMWAGRNEEVRELNAMARKSLLDAGELDPKKQVLTVLKDRDGIETEKHLAKGDRLFFLKNDTKLGVFNGNLGTVESVRQLKREGDVQVTIKIDEGERVSFRLSEYRHLDYGYAGTIHKGQGDTVDKSYGVVSQMTNKELSYVLATRHREECHFYIATESVSDLTKKFDVEMDTSGRAKVNLERASEIMSKSEEERIVAAFKEKVGVENQPVHGPAHRPKAQEMISQDHLEALKLFDKKDHRQTIEGVYKVATLPHGTENRYVHVVTDFSQYQKKAMEMLERQDFSEKSVAELREMVQKTPLGVRPTLTEKEEAAHYDRFHSVVEAREKAIVRHQESQKLYVSDRQVELLQKLSKEPKRQEQIKILKEIALTPDAGGRMYGGTKERGWLQQRAEVELKNFAPGKPREFAEKTLGSIKSVGVELPTVRKGHEEKVLAAEAIAVQRLKQISVAQKVIGFGPEPEIDNEPSLGKSRGPSMGW
jgi:conjugative relaxase-like TrwC/TraI family protein